MEEVKFFTTFFRKNGVGDYKAGAGLLTSWSRVKMERLHNSGHRDCRVSSSPCPACRAGGRPGRGCQAGWWRPSGTRRPSPPPRPSPSAAGSPPGSTSRHPDRRPKIDADTASPARRKR